MRRKHPEGRPGEAERLQSLRHIAPAAACKVDPESVAKALASFPKLSAGGPSALRPQHLKDALVPGVRD